MATTALVFAIGVQSVLATWKVLAERRGNGLRRRIRNLGRAIVPRTAGGRRPTRRLGSTGRRNQLRIRLAGAATLALLQYVAPRLIRGAAREGWDLGHALTNTVLRAALPGGAVESLAWVATSPTRTIQWTANQIPWTWVSFGMIPLARALPSILAAFAIILTFLCPGLLPALLRGWDTGSFAATRTLLQDNLRPFEPQLDSLFRTIERIDLPPQAREVLDAAVGPLRTFVRGATPAAEAVATAVANAARDHVPALAHRISRRVAHRFAIALGFPHDATHLSSRTPRRRQLRYQESPPPPYEEAIGPTRGRASATPHPPGHVAFPVPRIRSTRLGWAHRPDAPLGVDYAAFTPEARRHQEELTAYERAIQAMVHAPAYEPTTHHYGAPTPHPPPAMPARIQPRLPEPIQEIDLTLDDDDSEEGGSFAFERARQFLNPSQHQHQTTDCGSSQAGSSQVGPSTRSGGSPRKRKRGPNSQNTNSNRQRARSRTEQGTSSSRTPRAGTSRTRGRGPGVRRGTGSRTGTATGTELPTDDEDSPGANFQPNTTHTTSRRTRQGASDIQSSSAQRGGRAGDNRPTDSNKTSPRAGTVRRRTAEDPPRDGQDQPMRQRRRYRAPRNSDMDDFIVSGTESDDGSYEG